MDQARRARAVTLALWMIAIAFWTFTAVCASAFVGWRRGVRYAKHVTEEHATDEPYKPHKEVWTYQPNSTCLRCGQTGYEITGAEPHSPGAFYVEGTWMRWTCGNLNKRCYE